MNNYVWFHLTPNSLVGLPNSIQEIYFSVFFQSSNEAGCSIIFSFESASLQPARRYYHQAEGTTSDLPVQVKWPFRGKPEIRSKSHALMFG